MEKTCIKRCYRISLTVILITFMIAAIRQISKGDIAPIAQFMFVSAMTVVAFGNLASFLTYAVCRKSAYTKKDWFYVVSYSIFNSLVIICLGFVAFIIHIFSL